MQFPCIDACKTYSSSLFQKGSHLPQFLGNQVDYRSNSLFSTRRYSSYPCISCNFNENSGTHADNRRRPSQNFRVNCSRGKVRVKGKENVWSIDNEMVKIEKEKGRMRRRKKRGGKRVTNVNRKGDGVLVSGSMLMEVETVLQTQEPVIRPAWYTFTSSVSGIWKGVGAVYSPITAEMEPIEIGNRNENLFDCYTLSHIELRRMEVVLEINTEMHLSSRKHPAENQQVTVCQKLNLLTLEEDVMGMEPGLVFFEDGSYSRGPVDIPIGEFDESNYYLSPTFKFEQCLVKGCHKRLRVVHTIEFSNGGSDIQIMRVAVYEEEWVSPANIPDSSELELDLMPFSQRKRAQPSELTGSWKVFEVSATPIYGEDITMEESYSTPYVYLCTETLKKRSLPENLVYFGEEEMLDMQDVTVLWLPGGVTAYVDVNKEGILCVGVGWYSDEGINLVMERDYGLDGKLKEALDC
ncbi:UNVERIFIED_CONTAM: hypothetical protein Scaly_0214500 [Sesamum calycinum]|uniref:Uncharacterized protein n=1 Tax=Sesamum calycinum TaxID=2727403 RepID=A0AAW2T1G8_9LAMI